MHSLRIVHRDIKPDNLAFTSRGGEVWAACQSALARSSPYGRPLARRPPACSRLLSGPVSREPSQRRFGREVAAGALSWLPKLPILLPLTTQIEVKLIDFGFATVCPPNKLRGLSGTMDYAAPELVSWYVETQEGAALGVSGVQGTPYDEVSQPSRYPRLPLALPYTFTPSLAPHPHSHPHQAIDLWSFGVTLYIALCAFPPFFAEGGDGVVGLIRRGDFSFPEVMDGSATSWAGVSGEAKRLIASLLTVAPEDRLDAPGLLSNGWVRHGGHEESDTEPISAPLLAPISELISPEPPRRRATNLPKTSPTSPKTSPTLPKMPTLPHPLGKVNISPRRTTLPSAAPPTPFTPSVVLAFTRVRVLGLG